MLLPLLLLINSLIGQIAPNVSSVAVAASAGANANGSAWGDFEKPLDMLLEEKMEMWKEKGFQAPILRQVVNHDPTPMDDDDCFYYFQK